ncbi:MAG: energy-coupling factor transporter transmembrane component T [Spirochaetota bacterium]|nr:energy-coupling factor transporter transmembrane component T [Spirochaetota bacterium]
MISTAFRPGTSLLHRTDPRLKLLLLVAWTAAFIIPSPVAVILRYYLGVVSLITLTIGPKEVFPPLKSIWPILLLVILITPPFHIGGAEYFRISEWYRVTRAGVEEALTLVFRFTGITSAFFLFFRTTSIDQFILSLRWFGLPYNAALVITIAFRYIPSLIQLYGNIQDAHTLRRPPPERKRRYNPVRKISHVFPSLVSVMIHAIKSIPALSMALEIRGFGLSAQRTVYRPLPPLFSRPYQCGAAIIVLFMLILLYFI